MFRKAHIITFPALIAAVLLLTGCPPSPEFTRWKRPSNSVEEVKAAMTECGDPVGTSMTHLPINEQVLQFQCMQRHGFIRKDGFEYCEYNEEYARLRRRKAGSSSQLVSARSFTPNQTEFWQG